MAFFRCFWTIFKKRISIMFIKAYYDTLILPPWLHIYLLLRSESLKHSHLKLFQWPWNHSDIVLVRCWCPFILGWIYHISMSHRSKLCQFYPFLGFSVQYLKNYSKCHEIIEWLTSVASAITATFLFNISPSL